MVPKHFMVELAICQLEGKNARLGHLIPVKPERVDGVRNLKDW